MAISTHVLTVRTRAVTPGDPLYDLGLPALLPDGAPLSWVRGQEGIVGWGEAARVDTSGADRFLDAEDGWQRLCARMEVDDEVRMPGTGPVAFASLAFDENPGRSVLVVPEVVVGQRDGVRWVTTIGTGEAADDDHATGATATAPSRPGTIRYSDGRMPATAYRQAVAEAVRSMRGSGGVSKVVLAHDLLAITSDPLDSRFLLHNLAERYPDCWTFAVDGLVGATPELLLRREGDRVRSRVLAGTSWPRRGADSETLSAELLASPKNRGEHDFAVESLAATLRPFCVGLEVPHTPEVLHLRNVMHLASDVTGSIGGHDTTDNTATLLRMIGAVHPTAAVGGTPTPEAVRLIGELESMDRERYAGPVGWLDGSGNGEFGIALRCAQIEDFRQRGTGHQQESPGRGTRIRLFAGCGIVADSDPDTEVAEAQAKLLPMREALEGVR